MVSDVCHLECLWALWPPCLLTEERKMTEADLFSDRHPRSADGVFCIGLRGLQETVQGLKSFPRCLIASGAVNES